MIGGGYGAHGPAEAERASGPTAPTASTSATSWSSTRTSTTSTCSRRTASAWRTSVSRWSREYGVLSFTSDNGLYNRVKAYGPATPAIYPGSGPEGHCKRYGIEVSHSESFDNTIGWSGTAGNGTYTHDSKFHDNTTGITMDSFAGGHPGMPQDCSKWERNRIYSNNANLFNDEARRLLPGHAERGARPAQGLPTSRCRWARASSSRGGNGNIFKKNRIYDNWRRGTMLIWVPAEIRGTDPTGNRPSRAPTTPRTRTSTSTTDGYQARRPPRAQRRGLLVGRGRARETAGRRTRASAPAAPFTSDPLKLFPARAVAPTGPAARRSSPS